MPEVVSCSFKPRGRASYERLDVREPTGHSAFWTKLRRNAAAIAKANNSDRMAIPRFESWVVYSVDMTGQLVTLYHAPTRESAEMYMVHQP